MNFCNGNPKLPSLDHDVAKTRFFLQKSSSMAMSFYFFSLGTVVDSGVFAPVLTFQKLFEDEGVPITSDEVRAPMGVHKRVNTILEVFGKNM